ncbi:uncharacterized protein LOC144644476 [Oculina patagonica]
MASLAIARKCLTVLLVLAVFSETKASKHEKGEITIDKKAMERVIEQKTSEAIKKLEKQFKSTFMAYTSTNDKSKKHAAHEKLEGLVNLVKREAKENLEKSVKGYTFDVNRLSGKETGRVLVSSYIRNRRQLWGSCQPVCQHRCIPTCDLLCCITTPFVVPKKTVKILEKQLAKAHIKKKSKIVKKHSKKEHVCKPTCQKACLPSCKFSCCFTPKKH